MQDTYPLGKSGIASIALVDILSTVLCIPPVMTRRVEGVAVDDGVDEGQSIVGISQLLSGMNGKRVRITIDVFDK